MKQYEYAELQRDETGRLSLQLEPDHAVMNDEPDTDCYEVYAYSKDDEAILLGSLTFKPTMDKVEDGSTDLVARDIETRLLEL